LQCFNARRIDRLAIRICQPTAEAQGAPETRHDVAVKATLAIAAKSYY
jgi:hypothetical protein